jgi:DNA processing protein
MSEVRPMVRGMDVTYQAAVSLAALEVIPGEPSDLNRILRDSALRAAFFGSATDTTQDELVSWLRDEIDPARVEMWHKRLYAIERDLLARPVLRHCPSFPSLLRKCWDAPPLLFVRGCLEPDRPTVAIVGSRKASQAVIEATKAVARVAAVSGVTVVSGLAAGVDSTAHDETLRAGGHTIAVMGTGIQRMFPAENVELAAQIVEGGGALVSQFAPNAPRTGTTFLRRNAVIAGLAEVDVVMAGAERSGSRHQAERAAGYGRPVLLWKPTLAEQSWAQEMVDGGGATFIDDPSDVLRSLPGR